MAKSRAADAAGSSLLQYLARADDVGRIAKRTYIQPAPEKPVKTPGFLTRLLRSERRAKRVLTMGVKGLSVERFRRVLESQYCRVDSIERSESGNLVVVDFVFLSDNGYCGAVLSDKVADGSFIRCALFAVFGTPFGSVQLNDLNHMSKFLRFYNISAERSVTEFSIVTVDLSDFGLAANIEVFHDSVAYIVERGFTY